MITLTHTLVYICFFIKICSAVNTIFYLDEYEESEKKRVTMPGQQGRESVTIKASHSQYPQSGNYSLTITNDAMSSDYGLVATVQRFDLRHPQTVGTECKDVLTILQTRESNSKSVFSGCGSLIPHSFFLDNVNDYNSFVVKLEKDSAKKDLVVVELTVTLARKDYGHCYNSEFGCRNTYCISTKLKCNGIDNCGDNSDEDQMTCMGSETGIIIVTVIVLILILTMLMYQCCRYRREATEPDSNRTSDTQSPYPIDDVVERTSIYHPGVVNGPLTPPPPYPQEQPPPSYEIAIQQEEKVRQDL